MHLVAAPQVLFKVVRVDKARFADLKPVMIHVNYHVSSSIACGIRRLD